MTMLNDGEKGVVIQRDRETYAVAPHLPCGMITPEILRKVADVAEKYKVQAIKIIDYYHANAKPKERMGKMIERLGMSHMEEALGLEGDS
jgi:NAD(P)H-nitrite reductase large subunit